MDRIIENQTTSSGQPEVRVIMNPTAYKALKRVQELHESKAARRRIKLPFYARFVKVRSGRV